MLFESWFQLTLEAMSWLRENCLNLFKLGTAIWLGLSFAFPTTAEARSTSPLAVPPSGVSEKDDLFETESIHDDKSLLPSKAEEDKRFAALRSEELRLSQPELRGRFRKMLALAVGSSAPWITLGGEAGYFWHDNLMVTLHAGAGSYKSSGITKEKAYNLKSTARSTALSWHYYFNRFEYLALQGFLGYSFIEGHVTPYGTDEDQVEKDEDRISASFSGHGPSLGGGVSLTWLWESGLLIEWMPLAVRRTWLLHEDFSRRSPLIDEVVRGHVERATVYGLTNIKIGYLF